MNRADNVNQNRWVKWILWIASSHKSLIPCHLQRKLDLYCLCWALDENAGSNHGHQTSELSLCWLCIMGSLLPEPLGAAFFCEFFFLHNSTGMAVRQRLSKPSTTPPTAMTRLNSEPCMLSSRGRRPSGGILPWGTCFLWVRSREMCWMFVPRFFSAPISHASGGMLLISLLSRLLLDTWGFPWPTTEWYWDSTLLLPRPRLALSLDLTV